MDSFWKIWFKSLILEKLQVRLKLDFAFFQFRVCWVWVAKYLYYFSFAFSQSILIKTNCLWCQYLNLKYKALHGRNSVFQRFASYKKKGSGRFEGLQTISIDSKTFEISANNMLESSLYKRLTSLLPYVNNTFLKFHFHIFTVSDLSLFSRAFIWMGLKLSR